MIKLLVMLMINIEIYKICNVYLSGFGFEMFVSCLMDEDEFVWDIFVE